jgi:chromosome segregation ATPase
VLNDSNILRDKAAIGDNKMTWTEALPLLLAVIAAIPGTLALLKGRNKEKADAATAITDSAKKLLAEYRLRAEEIEDEYRAKITEYLVKIKEIEDAIVKQAEQIRCQELQIAQQASEVAGQRVDLDECAARIKDLEEERDKILKGVARLCTQIRNLGHEPVWEPG